MIKLLYIANVMNRVNSFCESSMKAALGMGIEFHIASNWSYKNQEEVLFDEQKYGIKIHQVDFIREPYDIRNLKAYKQVVELIKKEKINVIHCNTPIGGVIGRLAGIKCGINKIIYQAHGFHFYTGAPLINNYIYYPIEKWLASYTDALITINSEDYQAAKEFRLRNDGEVYFVHGVGIETEKFTFNREYREKKRKELGLDSEDMVLISVGRLDVNKNNETTIRALAKVPNVKLLLCGDGVLKESLNVLSEKYGVRDRVLFLGNRVDVIELYCAADIMVMMSYREGLSRSIMEAMSIGLPCVVSEIRGNTDLIENGHNGYLCKVTDDSACADAINFLIEHKEIITEMKENNLTKIKKYDSKVVEKEMFEIYQKILSC